MKAAVAHGYGPPDVVRVDEVPLPEPRRGEVRVRVAAAAVSIADSRIRDARFPPGFGAFARLAFGIRAPRRPVLGSTFAGTVDEVGPDVTGLRRGDRVAGMTGGRMGTHAEYALVAADRAVPMPDAVSDPDAAGMLFGATTALHFLRDKADLRPGASVLVIGASGAVGTSAVQLAHNAGATVTGVTSERNADLVRELGAERIVDYTVAPVSELAERFDVVIDTVGTVSAKTGRHLLADGGVLLLVVGGLGDMLASRGPVRSGAAPERPADFAELLQLMADGKLTSVTDSIHDLDGIVEAHRRVDSGHKVGNVIVTP